MRPSFSKTTLSKMQSSSRPCLTTRPCQENVTFWQSSLQFHEWFWCNHQQISTTHPIFMWQRSRSWHYLVPIQSRSNILSAQTSWFLSTHHWHSLQGQHLSQHPRVALFPSANITNNAKNIWSRQNCFIFFFQTAPMFTNLSWHPSPCHDYSNDSIISTKMTANETT